MKTFLLVIFLLPPAGFAQNGWEIPFHSREHAVEIVVQNLTDRPLEGLFVEAARFPSWMCFQATRQTIPPVTAGENATASFRFSVSTEAEIGTDSEILFVVSGSDQIRTSRTLRVRVASPAHFILHQNYPNPFNPATTIAFELPSEALVDLRVFNLIGEEVAIVSREMHPAGHHKVEWNAGTLPSGVYVYRLSAVSAGQTRVLSLGRTMMLVR